jgi:hypothetical protein
MLEQVVSGGQTGADQAAWRAAAAFGIATAGWMPRGFLTEDGPRSEFATLFGAREMPTDSYRQRTEQNVRDSHGTVWFGKTDTPGAKATLIACEGMGRPHLLVLPHRDTRPSDVAAWLGTQPQVTVLHVAGSRESEAAGIGDRVERFLTELFRQLGYHRPA